MYIMCFRTVLLSTSMCASTKTTFNRTLKINVKHIDQKNWDKKPTKNGRNGAAKPTRKKKTPDERGREAKQQIEKKHNMLQV